MQNPEQIRRFTRGVALSKDAPWLPIAAWLAIVPMLVQIGVVGRPWATFWLVLAVVATAAASRWFTRTYGVVTPSADAYSRLGGAWSAFGLAIVFVGLTAFEVAMRLPVALGVAASGAWLAWGAHASKGIRWQLYFLAAICMGLAFLPLITDQRALENSMRASIFSAAFGAAWAFVCVQDYRAIRGSLRDARG